MTSYALSTAILAFIVATCLTGLLKGGTAERFGAGIILANVLAGAVNQALFQQQLISMANNGLTALLLLPIAVRYASPWLGGVMLLYAVQFAIHAIYFVLERDRDSIYIYTNNLVFLGIGLCLLAGVVVAWRRRVRERRTTTSEAST